MSQTDSATARTPDPSATAPQAEADTAALAKGGRTNFFGFVLRLVARLPFLYFAGRWYGPEAVGRFAFAVLVIELVAQLATLGLKRGLAEQLSAPGADQRTVVWDGMFVAFQYSPQMYGAFHRMFREVKVGFTLLNLPPAFTYTCYK